MRSMVFLATAAFLAACGGQVPNDVGPGPYAGPSSPEARAARDAELNGPSVPAPSGVTTTPLDGTTPVPTEGEDVAAVPLPNNTSISDEQSFDAVATRQSIESDAERIKRNREQYEVIQPGEVPKRISSGPNIVYYALNTSHPVGTKLYNRIGLNKEARRDKNCAKFPSSDIAQQEFLRRGGPKKDALGLDPDGDGYACYWDPEPYRLAAAVSQN